MSFLTQSHQVFFRRPLCLIPSASHVIQRLTQSLSSFCSTSPNYLNLQFLIMKLTGSNPKRVLGVLHFSSFLGRLPKVDLIILEGKNVRPSVCPYVHPSVRPSTKSFFDLNEIWYIGRGWWVMHDGMPYGRIQGQGHEPFKVWIPSIFKTYLLRHLPWELASDH